MFYKTLRNSETGKKFQAIANKKKECNDAAKAFCKKYKIKSWRPARGFLWGGVSSCFNFAEPPGRKIWKNSYVKGEFFPNATFAAGKEILKEIHDLPLVSNYELNICVGYECQFSNIGFSELNQEYFGFSLSIKMLEEMKGIVPDDCIEITYTEYQKLFS